MFELLFFLPIVDKLLLILFHYIIGTKIILHIGNGKFRTNEKKMGP